MDSVGILWEFITQNGWATDEELELITGLNGYSVETLEDVLYYRTGYRSLNQITGEEDEESEADE